MIIAESWPEVRWYKPCDLGQLVDIHRACFPDESWKAEDFQRFIDNKSNRNNVVKAIVGERGVVYGSLLYTVEADAIRVRRLAVRPDVRRLGMGSFALQTLCGPNSPIRRKLFIARVREDNFPAIMLLKQAGFMFDPKKKRDRDAERGVDLYEFVKVKTEVPPPPIIDDE